MTRRKHEFASNPKLWQLTLKLMSNLKSGSTKLRASGSEQSDSTTTANTETLNASETGCSQPGNLDTKQGAIVIDGAFFVRKQKWGTFVSYDLNEKELITSLTEETCIAATRWYLKARQDGFTEGATTYDGTVGGKL
jgi:hypothetical protein